MDSLKPRPVITKLENASLNAFGYTRRSTLAYGLTTECFTFLMRGLSRPVADQYSNSELEAVEGEEDLRYPVPLRPERRRIIPAAVKLEVWKRDAGRCVKCGAKDELHFDHDLPFSLGGTSMTANNVQLLCARHNLLKGGRIA